MTESSKFQKLMEPGYIGAVRVKNRITKGGAHAGFQEYRDGYLHERHIGYYEAVAKGGAWPAPRSGSLRISSGCSGASSIRWS